MGESIEFTRNYSDLSTEHGFQFEFFCDRCRNGHRTRFKPFALGAVNNALDTANNLLGGLFGGATNVSGRLADARRERAREEALIEAIGELRPLFVQCPRCQSWVCRKSCWNNKRGICKNCSPDLEVEASAAQATKVREAVWEKPAASTDDQAVANADWSQNRRGTCPECGAALGASVKFCPDCGAKIEKAAFCQECGAKLQPGAKFCGECGKKV
jgi:DNA-directed RNA polymerase subunit M/transcription elongation factor TFIIS